MFGGKCGTCSAKKRIIAIVLPIIVILVSVLCIAFHKSDEDKIMSLANDLAIALNEGDSEKLLQCFEPSVQTQMKSLMGLGSDLAGVDFWDLWSLGSIGMSNSTENSELFITVYDISITSDTTATADISIDYGAMGDDRDSMKCKKIGGNWYFIGESLF